MWIKASKQLPMHRAHWITEKFGLHDNDFPVRMNGRYAMANIFDQSAKGEPPKMMIQFEGKDHYEDEFDLIEWLSDESNDEVEQQPTIEKNKSWPDEVRLKMIERSEFYQPNERVYQYGYYDGYQLGSAENEQLRKENEALSKISAGFGCMCVTKDDRENCKRKCTAQSQLNKYREALVDAYENLILGNITEAAKNIQQALTPKP